MRREANNDFGFISCSPPAVLGNCAMVTNPQISVAQKTKIYFSQKVQCRLAMPICVAHFEDAEFLHPVSVISYLLKSLEQEKVRHTGLELLQPGSDTCHPATFYWPEPVSCPSQWQGGLEDKEKHMDVLGPLSLPKLLEEQLGMSTLGILSFIILGNTFGLKFSSRREFNQKENNNNNFHIHNSSFFNMALEIKYFPCIMVEV